jgi:hypothetical protein
MINNRDKKRKSNIKIFLGQKLCYKKKLKWFIKINLFLMKNKIKKLYIKWKLVINTDNKML